MNFLIKLGSSLVGSLKKVENLMTYSINFNHGSVQLSLCNGISFTLIMKNILSHCSIFILLILFEELLSIEQGKG